MSKTIALINQKGGCGKTTISMNLASFLTASGYRSLVLDADPQQSATRWFQQGDHLAFDVRQIEMEEGARKVKYQIQALSTDYDVAILDLPPELKEPAMLACMLVDIALIPVKPSPLDLWAARAAIDLVKDAQELRPEKKPSILLLPSCVKTGTRMSKDIDLALSKTGEQVVPVPISERVALSECALLGETIDLYDPNSPACQEFKALSQFIIKHIQTL